MSEQGWVRRGPDGRPRCWWCLGADEYIGYHDQEWGRPCRDEERLFELLTLESFQSGLSWLTILRKRDGFRRAFASFSIEAVAGYGEAEVGRLLEDERIVRHRGKIEAAVANAGAALRLRAGGGSLERLLWSFEPARRGPRPRTADDLPTSTPESEAMAKELKRLGFRFLGPTTCYSLMQAAGIVDDHLEGCHLAR